MSCGVGDYTACLAEAVAKLQDVQVAVITSTKAFSPQRDIHYEIFSIINEWRISELGLILKNIRHWRPDIVHIQYPTQGYAGHILAYVLPVILFMLHIKVVQTWHEFYKKEHVNWIHLLKTIIPGPIIVVRPNYKENIHPVFRRLIRHKPMHFIPNASSLPRVILNDQERRSIHLQHAPATKALLVYFGFIYKHKGTDLLFEIADPSKHHLVIIGAFNETDNYHKKIRDLSMQNPWVGNVTITGFLSPYESAKILSAADAVILPFRFGGGIWNTSLHGAAIQGTFILTTSEENNGYNSDQNIYYAHPGDINEMQKALSTYLGIRSTSENIRHYASWDIIAETHYQVYKSTINS